MNTITQPLSVRGGHSAGEKMRAVANKLKEAAATVELAKQAPILCIFAVFACGFLYFMERRDQRWIQMIEREDKTAELRIENCHTVQAEATEAMKAVAEALQEQALGFRELSVRLQHHNN